MPGTQAQHLVRESGDDRDGDDPEHDPPEETARAECRVHQDGQDHHDQEEVRPAPHVKRGVLVDRCRIERVAMFVCGDGLVLSSVVLEDSPDLLHPPDEREVGQEQAHPDHALEDVPQEARRHRMAERPEPDERADHEDAGEEDERHDHRSGHLPRCELLVLLHRVIGGDGESSHPDRKRLAQGQDASHSRLRQEAESVADRTDTVRLQMERLIGFSDRDRPVISAAHHHALEDSLASVEVIGRRHDDVWSLPALRRPLAVASLEPLDPTAGVDQLLLARVERVARGADLHVDLCLRRTRGERVAARTPDRRGPVFGVDPLLHLASSFPSSLMLAGHQAARTGSGHLPRPIDT